jgi:hypothetical protein
VQGFPGYPALADTVAIAIFPDVSMSSHVVVMADLVFRKRNAFSTGIVRKEASSSSGLLKGFSHLEQAGLRLKLPVFVNQIFRETVYLIVVDPRPRKQRCVVFF